MDSKVSVFVIFIYFLMLIRQSATQDIETKPKALARIAAGTSPTPKQFPFVVCIQIHYFRLPYAMKCTGTILTPLWVVTASHCFTYENKTEPYQVTVTAGTTDIGDSDQPFTQVRQSVEVITHEDHKDSGHRDVAVLKVNASFVFNDYVKPIALIEKPLKRTEKIPCILMGFGRTQNGSNSRLFYIHGTAIKCTLLLALLSKYAGDTEHVCVTFDKPDTAVCSGDSGGPLICYNRLAAVAAGVMGMYEGVDLLCGADNNTFGFYASAYYFGPWIRKHIGMKLERSITRSEKETRNAGSDRIIDLVLPVLAFVCILHRAQ